MGKKLLDPYEKITQRSVGFPMRVHMFIAKYRDFNVDIFCRDEIDNQIAEIDPSFLSEKDPRRKDETTN